MRHVPSLALATLIFAIGCGDQPATAPNAPRTPRFDISDGAHDNGNDGFFFLPPMVKEPVTNSKYKDEAFHGGMRPRIEICALETPTQCIAGEPFKQFAQEQISVGTEHYQVNWDTKERALVDGTKYRIQVFVGDVRLGWADVQHADNRAELKNLDTDEFVPLVDGRTLPIKFRIEAGALCEFNAVCTSSFVDKDVGGTFYAADEGAAIDFDPGVLPVDVVVTVERVPVPPGGRCVPDEAATRVAFLQWEGCYRITTAPDIAPFGGFQGPTEGNPARAIVAVCVEPDVPANLRENLLLHKFDADGDPEVQRPEPIVPPFDFSCDGFAGTAAPAGAFKGLVRDAFGVFASAFTRLAGPRPLYALDGGLGCILAFRGALSTFFWGLPVSATASAGDRQEAEVGSSVLIPPAITAVTFHLDEESDPEVVSELPVVFIVTGGGGTLVNPAGDEVSSSDTVLTNAAGVASLPAGWQWRLGPAPGLNTLIASGPFEESPVVFTADGVLPPNISAVMQVPDDAPPLSPSTVAAGEPVTLHPWLVQNLGGPARPPTGSFSYGFYLSDDAVISSSDTRLGGASISNATFNAGAVSFTAPTLTIPLSTAPGVKYVGILVDEGQIIDDPDRANNVIGGIPVTIEGLGASVSDPSGDGGPTPSSSNDVIFFGALANTGTLTMRVVYAPGTRDDAFRMEISLDTDENPTTGHRGISGACLRDEDLIGAEYLVLVNGSSVRVLRYAGTCNQFEQVGTGGFTLEVGGDAFTVTVPLALLGGDSGRLRLKATTGSGGSSILDVVPDEGLPAMHVTSFPPPIP